MQITTYYIDGNVLVISFRAEAQIEHRLLAETKDRNGLGHALLALFHPETEDFIRRKVREHRGSLRFVIDIT